MSALIPMPSKSVLLDTTVVVQHFRETSLSLKNFLQAGGTAYLPLVVLAELHGGACRVVRKDRAMQQIQAFLPTATLLLPDEAMELLLQYVPKWSLGTREVGIVARIATATNCRN